MTIISINFLINIILLQIKKSDNIIYISKKKFNIV